MEFSIFDWLIQTNHRVIQYHYILRKISTLSTYLLSIYFFSGPDYINLYTLTDEVVLLLISWHELVSPESFYAILKTFLRSMNFLKLWNIIIGLPFFGRWLHWLLESSIFKLQLILVGYRIFLVLCSS